MLAVQLIKIQFTIDSQTIKELLFKRDADPCLAKELNMITLSHMF